MAVIKITIFTAVCGDGSSDESNVDFYIKCSWFCFGDFTSDEHNGVCIAVGGYGSSDKGNGDGSSNCKWYFCWFLLVVVVM